MAMADIQEKDGAYWLRENLEKTLLLPADAIEWLVMLFKAIQVFDDYADGDSVNREDLNSTIWNTLVGMSVNSFYVTNFALLSTAVGLAIMKWRGSDAVERCGSPDEKTYMWRAGYYDVVLLAVGIVHGHEKASLMAPLVMAMYGERFSDYIKEYGNA